MNLELNFVYNSDMAAGEYLLALKAFDNVIRIRNDHAFAHYFAALCHRELKDVKRMAEHLKSYLQYGGSEFWTRWTAEFDLVTSAEQFALLPAGQPATDLLYQRCERYLAEIDTQ